MGLQQARDCASWRTVKLGSTPLILKASASAAAPWSPILFMLSEMAFTFVHSGNIFAKVTISSSPHPAPMTRNSSAWPKKPTTVFL
eukprot:1129509-Prymnesium_polylepis.2